MKKSIQFSILLSVFIACISCKKSFLEITPKGLAIATSTADYEAIMNNFTVGSMLSPVTGYASDVQIAMGDEIIAFDPYLASRRSKYQRAFTWADNIYDPTVDADELGFMPKLYVYNKVINEIMASTDGTNAQKVELLSEAKAIRAFFYFYFIQWYGKPYEVSTASNDPGFPIVTTADITTTNFTRASVQEVYDFIISDLTSAIPNLRIDQGTRLRMNKTAAETLLGKVYTFMGKYSTALPYFNAAFNDLPGATSLAPVSLYNLNTTLAIGASWGYTATSYKTFVQSAPSPWFLNENMFSGYISNYWTALYNDFVITPATVALYKPSDMRLHLYTPYRYGGSSYTVSGIMRRNGLFYTETGIVLQDLYLLRAECRARTGDITGAQTDLLNFRTTRMPVADAAVSITDPTALVKFIIDERTREFAVQGYRWFDMRRLSVDPIFSGNSYTHTWYNADGTVKSNSTLTPNRLTLRLPQKIIDQNPAMVNNP